MKNLNKFIGIIALLAVIGFSMAACDNGTTDNGGGNPFVGTWNGSDGDGDAIRLVVTSSTWTVSWPGNPEWGTESGTYTYSGNTATLSMAGEGVVGTATVSGNTMTGILDDIGFTVTK